MDAAAGSAADLRDRLLVLLAVVAGSSDATAFERLGHVFASVITGNLVLLGFSGARADATDALYAVASLGGYVLGALASAPTRAAADAPVLWPASTTRGLILEAGTLLGFTLGWELAGAHPSRPVQLLLLVLLAFAMGVQSVAVRRLGAGSTTYLTGSLTGMLEALRARRWSRDQRRDLRIIVAAIVGAAAATELLVQARATEPLLPLLALGIVLTMTHRTIRDR